MSDKTVRSSAFEALQAEWPESDLDWLPRNVQKGGSASTCDICGKYHRPAGIHLPYVGHAKVTERLLTRDPEWTWEFAAFDANGVGLVEHDPKTGYPCGLWIKLTVLGVTRYGYGAADPMGKGSDADTGEPYADPGDLMKELVGDAIRNAAMRFGVGLYLWMDKVGRKYGGQAAGDGQQAGGDGWRGMGTFAEEVTCKGCGVVYDKGSKLFSMPSKQGEGRVWKCVEEKCPSPWNPVPTKPAKTTKPVAEEAKTSKPAKTKPAAKPAAETMGKSDPIRQGLSRVQSLARQVGRLRNDGQETVGVHVSDDLGTQLGVRPGMDPVIPLKNIAAVGKKDRDKGIEAIRMIELELRQLQEPGGAVPDGGVTATGTHSSLKERVAAIRARANKAGLITQSHPGKKPSVRLDTEGERIVQELTGEEHSFFVELDAIAKDDLATALEDYLSVVEEGQKIGGME